MNGIKSLSDFLLQGKTSGKKVASGNLTQSGSQIYFTDCNGMQVYANPVLVNTLDFKPSMIILIARPSSYSSPSNFYSTVYCANGLDGSNTATIYTVRGTSTFKFYKLGDNGFVNTTGFRLPTDAVGVSIDWYAFE